jgi:murein DD-endopeptidase MepM/ murein hydrolase activator NlpD
MFGSALGLLMAPSSVGVEHPALRHFILHTLAAAPPASPAGGSSIFGFVPNPLAGIQLPSALLVAVLVPCLLLTLALMVLRRAVSPRFRRWVDVTALPFGAAAALSLVLLVPKIAPSATTDLTAGPAAVDTAAPSAAAVSTTAAAGPAVWQQLLRIERSLTQLQAQLQTSTVASQTALDDPTLHPARAAGALPQSSQQATAVRLENALQTEYSFYLDVVSHPDQQQALLGATQAVSPNIRDAVVYDLQAVEAQLAQEAAIQAAQQSALAGTGPAPATLRAPELGTITQGFGASTFALEPPLTYNGVTYPHFHTGVDIAAPLDTPVAAAADGVVVIAGSSTDIQGNLIGYGNYVVIAHAGKMVTLYGHLDKLLVSAGQLIHAGDVIGLEGSTGNSTGPHLHFEVRVGGLLANPMQYMGTQIQAQ